MKGRRRSEFGIIAEILAPLATHPGAFALGDDAAALPLAPGDELVVTADALVAGVHFLADDPPEMIGRKALRINLSDLAAMGAAPVGYLMALALPGATDDAWLEAFAAGLGTDQAAFGVSLLGGDLVATPGPLTISVTALGSLPAGTALRRSGARPGEDIYVTGTIGDGILGLRVAGGADFGVDAAAREHLLARFRLPEPRLAVGAALRGGAGAAMDVSDGLMGDLAHICEASGCGAEIVAAAVPLSPAARIALEAGQASLAELVTGGDDYELLFTAAPGLAAAVTEIAARCDIAATRIGRVLAGGAPSLVDDQGRPVSLGTTGYRHF